MYNDACYILRYITYLHLEEHSLRTWDHRNNGFYFLLLLMCCLYQFYSRH